MLDLGKPLVHSTTGYWRFTPQAAQHVHGI